MWRSIFKPSRYATITLQTHSGVSATSSLKVRHVIISPNSFKIASLLNPNSLFFSTNPDEPDTEPSSIAQSNQLFDNKIEESGQTQVSISPELCIDDKIEESGQTPVSISPELCIDDKIEESGQTPVSVSPELCIDEIIEEIREEGGLVEVANEVDLKELDAVLSLLQSSINLGNVLSLASALDEMDLASLNEEFVVKVLETPLVPGENLISFFKWGMKKTESFSPTSRSFEALVRAVSGQKMAYAVWGLINEVGKTGISEGKCVLNTSILNGLIAALSKFGKAKDVFEVFNKFDDLGGVPDSDTYFFTIDVLCRRSFHKWACLVVEKMIGSGKLPEGERVGKIISYLCKGEKTKEAHSVYLLAKEKNKYPPRSSVNFLISSLSQGDKTVHLGLEMLSDFSIEERKFAIKQFSSVIRGLCRIKDVGAAKDLLSKMIEEGPPPGNAVFNSIIGGLSKAGEMGEAKEMVKMMESRGLKPDVFTYTVIISGYTKGGEMDEACKVLSEAKEKHSKLSHVTYHTLIRGYCKLGEFDKAVKLLGEMKEFGVEPNVDEYNKLIQTLCLKALDFETAEKLLEEMKEKGLHLNGITKALLRAGKEVAEEEKGASGGGEEAVAV